MKKLLFISLTCLIVATSLGQNKNNQKLEIPKKSNTIELTTTYKTQQEALNEIVKILLREGIEPEKIDSSAFFITSTCPRKLSISCFPDTSLAFVTSSKMPEKLYNALLRCDTALLYSSLSFLMPSASFACASAIFFVYSSFSVDNLLYL